MPVHRSFRAICALIPASILLGLPAGSRAEAPPFLPSAPDSFLGATLDSIPGTPLELRRALELAAGNAPAVREAGAAVDAARGAVRRERGSFDPELFASVLRSSEAQPSASPFSGADVLSLDLTTARGGARLRLPFGTEFEASLNSTRSETNSLFSLLNPEFDTFGLLSVRQPLLSGFGPSARAGLSSADRALEAAQARYRDVTLGVEAETEGAYWEVYAAERDYAVSLLIRDRARIFVTESATRARAGIVGPSAVANAKVFLADQELAVLDSQERLDRASDRLASLLGMRPDEGVPRFRPVDQPPREHDLGSVEPLVSAAIAENHEIQAQRATVEQIRALARGATWDALPTLDFVGSLGAIGLSGTSQEVVFGADTLTTEISGGFGDTWDQVRGREFPTWTVGLELTLPLGSREGRGERDRLRAEVARAEERVKGNENALEEEVRRAHRELSHGQERVRAALDGVNAALEQVRIGGIEYRNGRTTAFELVRLGADVAASQEHYSQALVSAAKAAARLRYLTSGAYGGASPR